jgi:RNA polymerase sigma-54 factor
MFEMGMTQETGMRVTPMLLNLVHLLALPSLDLQQAVQQELSENPALEEVEADEATCPRCGEPMLAGICWRCASDSAEPQSLLDNGEEDVDPLLFVAAPRSFSEVLLADLYASLPEEDHPIALALVGNLDDQGFLANEAEEIAAQLGVSAGRVGAVLRRLRELGPPGIASRDTRECLLVQIDALAAQGITCPHARELVADHLADLGTRSPRQLARELHLTATEVENVRAFIKRYLWPYPAQAAGIEVISPHRPRYRTADLVIRETDDGYVVEVLHSPRRMLRINPLYQELAGRAATLEEGERAHVQEYISRARIFLTNLRQRESTLQRIGEVVVARQEPYLRHGVRHLAPLTRAEIAGELGLHESTVSRAINEKTALLPNSTLLPMSEFFVAARGVQDALRELIANEAKPLSDDELARLLTAEGFPVARRTVAKYRDQMKISPSHLR